MRLTRRARWRAGALGALALCVLGGAPVEAQDFDAARARMIRTLETYRAEMERFVGPGALDPAVLAVMGAVPRHAFVPAAEQRHAYENRPLPIGSGQTISQPLIVALMTSVLAPRAGDVALEVGTGSGYQAAVLARLVRKVHTIEIVPALAEQARERLTRLGYDNVEVRTGDGYQGWPEAAPFDRIVVTAAPDEIPRRLVEQLKPGGRMVLPVGERFATQQLTLVEKDEKGATRVRELLPVRFVPMIGGK